MPQSLSVMITSSLLIKKRDGNSLSDDEIRFLVDGFCRGEVADYQMSALAMAICLRGMNARETTTLTRAMLESGRSLSRGVGTESKQRGVLRVDKHSTGGLGDKVSLILAPLLAACGFHVPMISGRGLGLTGGTLDKLESIPGLRTDLSEREMNEALDTAGCFIAGASEQIAPADRKLYALRDVTGTVESVPLITASILSKKLAENLDSLVMDVKTGSGAFMKNERNATELAESIVRVGNQAGLPTTATLSDMDQPLGETVGNAIEVQEARDVLLGKRGVTAELTLELGCELILTTRSMSDRNQAKQNLQSAIDDGTAMERFEKMIAVQGGRLNEALHLAPAKVIEAKKSGMIKSFDCEAIGEAIIELGGGRRKQGDSIDHRVGFRVHGRIGERVEKGDPLLTLHCDPPDVERCREKLKRVVAVSEGPVAPKPLILKRIATEP